MYGFSTVDGFMDVKESVDEMIKYLANEPSVGLFFVQQHAQAAMPNLLTVKAKVVEKTHEVTLHTEDTEDSIIALRSMTECGLPIADEMIKDINRSLLIMSTSQPKKGLIHNPSWGFQVDRSSLKSPAASSYSTRNVQQDGGSSRSYLSSVFNSAKKKAAGLRWPQPDLMSKNPKGEQLVSSTILSSSAFDAGPLSTPPDTEADELPLSSHLVHDQHDGLETGSGSAHSHYMSSPMLESYDEFKSEQEAKLEEWLQQSEDRSRFIDSSD